MEVGNPLHAAGHVGGAGHFTGGLFFIVVISQHETQQQAWHDNIADAQHGEVAASGARKHQFAGQRETGDVPAHARSQMKFARQHVQWVVGRLRGHFHHHVTVEDVGGEEDLQEKRDRDESVGQSSLPCCFKTLRESEVRLVQACLGVIFDADERGLDSQQRVRWVTHLRFANKNELMCYEGTLKGRVNAILNILSLF